MNQPTRLGLLAALGFSVTLNIGLLTYAYYHVQPGHVSAPTPQGSNVPIKIGAPAPLIRATDLNGSRVSIDPTTKATVIYVLRPDCGWCEKNTPNIVAFAKQAADRYRFVGLSLDKKNLDTYLKRFPLPFPTYIAGDETIVAYGFAPTPSTVVISDGKVVYKVNGAYDPHKSAIESFLKITLPGMSGG